jgi:FtsH-binding integral membrane protein
MCTFFNRRCRSENSDALLYLKLWYSFYIRVEYRRLHENNLARRAQLMCGVTIYCYVINFIVTR